jgi:hypothetical protein
MKLERRGTRRERPKQLSYIHFEPEGGGIVVNASEHGLAFQAAAALRQTGPIQLCVSPNPMERIKLTAEIAWMDEKKKSGGLRLTELTADAKSQMLQWLTQNGESEAPAGQCKVRSGALVEGTDLLFRPGKETQDQLQPAADSAMPTGSDSATVGAPRSSTIPSAILPAPFSRERLASIPRQPPLRGLATAFLILAFAFMAMFVVQHFRNEIGASLIRMGERLTSPRDTQPDASRSIPGQISKPNSVNAPAVPDPIAGTPAKEAFGHADPVASPQTSAGTENSANSRLADQHSSRRDFTGAHPRRGRSALARQLWSALGAGDSSAEVPLAQLYLSGDGVPKNCQQARVLLKAASKNGDIEALRQLRQLNKSGCK